MFTNRAKNGANNLCGRAIARYRTEPKKSQRQLADMLQIAGLDIDKMQSSGLRLENGL